MLIPLNTFERPLSVAVSYQPLLAQCLMWFEAEFQCRLLAGLAATSKRNTTGSVNMEEYVKKVGYVLEGPSLYTPGLLICLLF